MAARFEIQDIVVSATSGASTLRFRADAAVTVKDLQGNNLTTYAAETGSTTVSNPITPDSSGRVEGWVEAPDYDLAISVPGIGSYTQKIRQSAGGTFDVKSYGAKGDGTTDDTAADQAAITPVAAFDDGDTALGKGAEVFFPPTTGGYKHATTLNCDDTTALHIRGGGTFGGGRSRIKYTGVATAFTAKSSIGLLVEGMHFEGYDCATLIDLSRGSGGDTTMATFRNCVFRGTNGATAQTLLKVTKATIVQFERCRFYGGEYAVDPSVAAGVYANRITFDNCWFQYQKTAPIHNPLRSWTFTGCEVEPLNNGNAGFILYDLDHSTINDGVCYLSNLVIDGVRCEDANGSGSWIKLRGNTRSSVNDVGAITVRGSSLSNGAKHIEVTGSDPIDGLTIEGNEMLKYDDTTVLVDVGTSLSVCKIGPNQRRDGMTYISGALGQGSVVQDRAFGLAQVPAIDSASSVASTFSRKLAGLTSGTTFSTANVYGGRVVCQNGGTFSKVRLCTGTTFTTPGTDFRVGVWNSSGTKLGSSANVNGTVTAANTEYEISLAASVTVKVGDIIFVGFGHIGGTSLQFIAMSFRNSTMAGLSPIISGGSTSWTTGNDLPNISTGSAFSSIVPWAELVA